MLGHIYEIKKLSQNNKIKNSKLHQKLKLCEKKGEKKTYIITDLSQVSYDCHHFNFYYVLVNHIMTSWDHIIIMTYKVSVKREKKI